MKFNSVFLIVLSLTVSSETFAGTGGSPTASEKPPLQNPVRVDPKLRHQRVGETPSLRGIYISQETEDHYFVSLRDECRCNPGPLCRCWHAPNAFEDAPVLQGDLRKLVEVAGGFPGFRLEGRAIVVPKPHILKKILAQLGLADRFYFARPGEVVDGKFYRDCLARGQIPISETNGDEGVGSYLHDLGWHFLLWALAPEELRKLVTIRIVVIQNILSHFTDDQKHSEDAQALSVALLGLLAIEFDEGQANLAKYFFEDYSNCGEDLASFARRRHFRPEFQSAFDKMLNFSRKWPGSSKALSYSAGNGFFRSWVKIQIEFLQRETERYRTDNRYSSLIARSPAHYADETFMNAFLRLVPDPQVLIDLEAKLIQGIDQRWPEKEPSTQSFRSPKKFCNEMKERLRALQKMNIER